MNRPLHVGGGLHGLADERRHHDQQRHDDDDGHRCGAEARGARRAVAVLELGVHGMEDDHQHGRPPERHEKRLDHQEDEVQEDRQRE